MQYAGRGWPIFRLSGKVPLKGSRGFKDATLDPQTIERWWCDRPDANIGLATGHGIVVLDVDGEEGLAELRALVAIYGPLPRTLSARTGTGLHAYFTYSGADIKSSARGKLHVRASGGFVVVPPSLHPNGRRYEWIDPSLTVAELPNWLKEWMINGSKQTKNSGDDLRGRTIPLYLQTLPRRDLARRATEALNAAESTWSEQEQKRIESALTFISAFERETWRNIGMILKDLQWVRSDGSDIGFEIWDEWSQTCEAKYPGVDGLLAQWNSFGRTERADRVGPGTLFALAQANGFEQESVRDADLSGDSEPNNADVNGATAEEHEGVKEEAGASDPANETELNGHPFPFDEPHERKTKKNPLIEFNDKYAVVGDLGGKCLVMSWIPSKVDEHVKIPSFQSFKAFTERYANRYVIVPKLDKDGARTEKTEPLGAYWLKWPKRKSYDGIDLAPGGGAILPNGYLNLWHGFAPKPQLGCWDRMKWHIYNVLAGGDAVNARYIVSFAAWAIQHPGERAEVALVFRGGKGSGKGTFANALVRIFGSHGLQIYSSKHLVGAFNGHLRSCLLLFADEAFWAGDKQGESVLKGMLTESTLVIEQKGVDATPWKNRLHVIMAANADWVVPASHDERRYAMFDVSGVKIGDRAYFEALHAEINNGGLAAMLHDLQRLQLGTWHPRQIIHTAALREQKERSLDPKHEWWESVLQSGRLPGTPDAKHGGIGAAAIYARAQDETPRLKDVSRQAFGRFLRTVGAEGYHRENGEFWQFKPLTEMRKIWESKFYSWSWRNKLDEWIKW